MRFDFYAEIGTLVACPTGGPLPAGLASGFTDGCTCWSCRDDDEKNEARRCYIERLKERLEQGADLKLPDDLMPESDPDALPAPTWVHVEARFTLVTPWYSKDDRPFHVLDNPVRKDRVFGLPFMAAASWKGLLRWACRVQAGLLEHLEKHDMTLDGWRDPRWIVHMFGNEKGEDDTFQRGALAFHPTWFSRLGFEVINPHSREKRAGTQPIYYEVVPAGTEGRLRLLYAPLPGGAARDQVDAGEAIANLLDAMEALLTSYGISAKRTVGWGTASIEAWTARRSGEPPIEEDSVAPFKTRLKAWLVPEEGA